LAPAFANAIDDVLGFIDAAKEIPGVEKALSLLLNPGVTEDGRSATLAGLVSDLFDLGEETKEVNVVTDQMAKVWAEGKRAMIDAQKPTQNLTSYLEDQETAVARVKDAIDRLKGTLNLELAMMDAKAEIEGFRKKWEEALKNGQVNADEFNRDVIGIQLMLLQLRADLGVTATAFLNNEFRLLVDTRQLDRAWQLLQAIKAGGELKIPTGPGSGDAALMAQKTPPANQKPGGVYIDGYYIPPGIDFSKLANGKIVNRPEMAMIGEAGPEAVIPLSRPARAMELMQASGLDMLALGSMRGSGGGGGGDTYITVKVDAGLVSSPDQVGQQIIEAIKRAERRSGQVFASV
jgi:hypothetical protein